MSKNIENRDIYIIPPNFIEGGTFFGGMFKARNAVEAGILAVATGLPVLNIGVSLTNRIIILCVTTLPLVLFALIGVGGESLSAFIWNFFKFLRNRRIVGVPKKRHFPRLFEIFNRKGKEKETRFLNPTAEYIPIEKIANGIIYTRDRRYVKIIEIVPINFALRNEREKRNIIYSFISYLKVSSVKLQFKVLTKRADINRHLDAVNRELERENDEKCRLLQQDYINLIRQVGSKEAITRRFFIVFEYEPYNGGRRANEETEAISALQTAARSAANYLRQCGNEVVSHEDGDEFTIDVLYSLLNRKTSSIKPLSERATEVLNRYSIERPEMNVDNIPCAEFIQISPASKHCINVMDIRKSDKSIDELLDGPGIEKSELASKIQKLHIFFSLLIPDMNHEERQLLDDALIKTYALKGITHNNETLTDPQNPENYKEMPILGDLYEVLKQSAETKRLANILNRLVNGSASAFNQQTNVNLDNKYTVLDISELTGDLLTVGMFVALDFVWDKAKENRTIEKAIFIDECWQLIGASSNRLAAEFVLEIFKKIRGYGGSAVCATQDLSDFFALEDGKYGKGIINNSKTKIVLNLEDEEAQRVQSILRLSEAEVMEITHFERGNGLISTNNNNITVEFKSSLLERNLITSDRRELQELLSRKAGK